MNKKEQKFLIGMLFLTMLILSISFSFVGIFIPTFKEVFNISDKLIGLFLSVIQIITLVSYMIANKFSDKFGQKKLMLIGLLISAISFTLVSYSQTFSHLLIGYIFITFALSFMLLSINTTLPLIQVSFQSALLNMVHGFFGFGNTLSQKIIAILLNHNIEWQEIYRYISFGFLFTLFLYMFVYDVNNSKSKNLKKIKIKQKKELALFIFALGFYVSAEIQTGNWFMNLLKNNYSITTLNATTYTALFFGLFTTGRFIGGFITEKFGYFKSIITSSTISIIIYLIGMILKINGLYFISLSGLFFAIIYPTTIALVGKIFTQTSSKAIAIISTSVSIFVLISSLLIANLNDLIGPYLSFYLIPIFQLISLFFYIKLNSTFKEYD
ncbi:MAG: MFS transporter [Bacillota bacterium]|nr:MFS transporter [Bacillota bacterium]